MDIFLSSEKSSKELGRYISSVVIPVLPLLIGNCIFSLLLWMMEAVRLSITAPFVYQILELLNSEIYFVLPFLIGASACRRLEVKVLPGLILVATLLEPPLREMAISLSLILKDPQVITGMQLAILPLLLVIYLYSKITSWLEKISKLYYVKKWMPYISMVIVAVLVRFIIYPIGNFLDNLLSVGILFIFLSLPVCGSMVLGLLSPLLHLCGFLFGGFPVTIASLQIDEVGYLLGPGLLAACVCQGTAAIYYALKEKEVSLRRRDLVCGILGFVAFLTPVLLVVNVRDKKLLASGMMGGFFSGLYYGIFQVVRFTNTLHLLIGLVLGIVVTIGCIQVLQPVFDSEGMLLLGEEETLTNQVQQYRIK